MGENMARNLHRNATIHRTEEEKKKIKAKMIQLMENDDTLGYIETCHLVQVPKTTVNDWRKKDKKFHHRINELIDSTKWLAADRATKNIYRQVQEGDFKASAFLLRSRPESRELGWDFSHHSKEDDTEETAEKIAALVNAVSSKMKKDA